MNICIVSPSLGYGGSNIISTLGKELNKNHNLVYYSYSIQTIILIFLKKNIFFKGRHSKLLDKFKKV